MKFKRLIRSINVILLIVHYITFIPTNMYYAQDEAEQPNYEIITENETAINEPSNSMELVDTEISDDIPHHPEIDAEEDHLNPEENDKEQIESSREELNHSAQEPKQFRLADLLVDVELFLPSKGNLPEQRINLMGERLDMDTEFTLRYSFKLPEGETLQRGDLLLSNGLEGINYPPGNIHLKSGDGLKELMFWGYEPMTLYNEVDGDTFYAELTTSLSAARVQLGGELRFSTFDREVLILAEEPGDAEMTTYAWRDGETSGIPEEIIQLFNNSQSGVVLDPDEKYLNWVVEVTPGEPAVKIPSLNIGLVGAHLLAQGTIKVYNASDNSGFRPLPDGHQLITIYENEFGNQLTEKYYVLFRTRVTVHEKETVYRVTNLLQSKGINLLKTTHSISIPLEEANTEKKDIQADSFIKSFSIWQNGALAPYESVLDRNRPILLRYTIEIPDEVTLNDGDRLLISIPPEIALQPDYGRKLVLKDVEGNNVAEVSGQYGHEKLIFKLTSYFSENTSSRYINIDIPADIGTIHEDDRIDITYPNHQGYYMLRHGLFGSLRKEMIEKYIAPPQEMPVSLLPNLMSLDTDITNETVYSGEEIQPLFPPYVYETTVDWVVYINPLSFEVGDVTITDTVEEGHELKPETITIYNGYSDYSELVTNANVVAKSNGFEITVPNVNSPIRVSYTTRVTNQSQEEFHNRVRIDTKLKGSFTAHAMSRIDRGGNAGHKVKPVDIPVQAVKKLNGRELSAGEFEFELLKAETRELLAVATNDAEGVIRFDGIQADKEGTYEYIIRERATESDTLRYDDKEHLISAVVRKEDKQLVIDSITSPPTFTNTYQPLPTQYTIEANKQLTGRSLEAGEFTFELIPTEAGQATLTATNDAQGAIRFADIPATSAGTYTYTLREQAGNQPGVTYDSTEHSITVIVTDNNGQLEVDSITPAPTFTNTYRPLPTQYTIEANKQLTGRSLEAGEFMFELIPTEAGQATLTATNDTQGAIRFADIPATSAGTYTYTLREQAGNQPGVTYDSTEHSITVIVTDNNGQLEVDSITPAPTFTNTYRPLPTEYTIRAKSVLEGKQQEAGQFTFELWDDSNIKLGTTTNDALGNITFESVELTEVGNRVFTIREIPQASKTITYLTESEEVSLSIEDQAGQLIAKSNRADIPTFYHRYKPLHAEHTLEAQVRMDDCMLTGEALMYELVDEMGTVVQTTKSDNRVVRFKPMRFEEVATKRYILRQVAGTDVQVTYAKNQPEITLTVVDNDGQLVVSQQNSEELIFVNEYQPRPIEYVIKVKVNLAETDTVPIFSFELLNEKSEVVATAQNDAKGDIIFDSIQFSETGTYRFEIKQVTGDSENITYDKTVYTLTVEVDEVACSLMMNAIPGTPIVFDNTLIPEPPQSSDESSSSSSEPEPPQSSDESSSSSSEPEPPQSSDESSNSSSEPEPPQSSDESSSSSSEPEPPQSSDESSSSSSEPEPPRSSDESSNSSSEPEPPQSSDESSSSSSEPEPPQSSDESSNSSSEPEPPQSSDESSNSSSEPEPPQSSDESSNSSSEPEPPQSDRKLPKTGENPTLLLWISIILISVASLYAKVARKDN